MTGKDETRPSEGEGQGAKCGQGQRDAGAGRERSDVRQALRKKTGLSTDQSTFRDRHFKGRDIGMWVCVWGLPLLRIPRAAKTRIESRRSSGQDFSSC